MRRIGVVGAGTMGTGIAQVAAQAKFDVLLYDVDPAALTRALRRVEADLERHVARGRLTREEAAEAVARITTTTALGDFARAEFVIEAAPEELELKRGLFERLDRLCRTEVVLATNTSSLSVTQIGALAGRPERVVGMHFFNPVPAMRLVEVVAGDASGEAALQAAEELARALGKEPVRVKDTPGFIVNRVARPYSGEALRLLGEQVATVAQIDRIARLACGFRMGPFELMDLVGLDINFAVHRSVFEQYFGEPRFRPHPLQERMVKAGRLGRKTGVGWYCYEDGTTVGGPEPARYAAAPTPRVPEVNRVAVLGDPDLADLTASAGYRLVDCCADADLIVLAGPELLEGRQPDPRVVVLVEASTRSTTEMAGRMVNPARLVGYGGIPRVSRRQLVEVAPGLRTDPSATDLAVRFFHSLGRDTEVVADGPGLVAARLLACLVNEAAFALQEGVATAAGIDAAMRLGVNYPKGPLEWADEIGPDRVLAVLEGLQQQTGEERYRAAPYLRKRVQAGLGMRA
ncbi:3-hydroxybutyryl-CoA dehydrogenase [Symbiobacterium terraclitae]|uniref:3-hydroxybutyryl-CoA dehydrogenase n=1 Tax=Symbiobacterium terraclitae TaxID=557451 RepID=A0ABS4JRA9_9FIRM|nr:3-hydroxybutyryl-CoA dehydrogenase [Symbiobacterium terraclitae]